MYIYYYRFVKLKRFGLYQWHIQGVPILFSKTRIITNVFLASWYRIFSRENVHFNSYFVTLYKHGYIETKYFFNKIYSRYIYFLFFTNNVYEFIELATNYGHKWRYFADFKNIIFYYYSIIVIAFIS